MNINLLHLTYFQHLLLKLLILMFTLTILWMSSITLVFAQRHIYVSPTGDDRNSGNSKKPLKTISAVQEKVKYLLEESNEDINVHLRPGNYYLKKTLEFDHSHSSGAGTTIRYISNHPGEAVIHSGVLAENWVESEYEGIYKTQVKAIAPFRQLYVNGEKAVRSRYPDTGYLYSSGWDIADRKLILQGGYGNLLYEVSDAELVLFQSWAESYLRIKKATDIGLTTKFTEVEFQDREEQVLFNRPYPMHEDSHPYYFENALGFITEGREWYHDPTDQMLYYKPLPHEDIDALSIVYPTLDTLVKITGTDDKPLENIEFEGVSFQYANWSYPSENGYLNGQTGQHNYAATPDNQQFVKRPASAIYVANAKEVAFKNCVFKNLGATGVDFHFGTQYCSVTGSSFSSISGNAISVGKFTQDESTEFHTPYNPSDQREVSRYDTISSNVITNVASDYFGCVGIAAGYPIGLQITHNVISDLPYTGISLGYGWTDQSNAMRNNVIAYNEVFDVVKKMNDGSGIYTLSYQPGTKIYRNYIHGISKSEATQQTIVAGIYCDEKSGGSEEKPMIIEDNIIGYGIPNMLKMHQPGIILIKNTIHSVDQGQGKEIVSQIGLKKRIH